MTAKEQLHGFESNKKLLEWWGTVVGDSRFEQIVMFLKADTFEGRPSPEQMQGVTSFIENMQNIVFKDAKPVSYPQPHLSHGLEIPRRTVDLNKSPEKKTLTPTPITSPTPPVKPKTKK